MTAVGKVIQGRSRVRCDGCGRISSDRDQGAYFDRERGGWGSISSRGRECEHDFCDECEPRLNLPPLHKCCKCGRSPNAIECGAEQPGASA